MADSRSVKSRKTISIKPCTHCFVPTHLKFNFSFISYEKNFSDEHKLQLLKRIRELSSVPYLEVASWKKNIGFEIEKIDINAKIDKNFFEGTTHRNFDDKKYCIFRLYTNDNPILARVIGRLINNVFYIFFIDIGGNLYKHGH